MVAIFDTISMALTIVYAASVQGANIAAVIGILLFYLLSVVVMLAKISAWHYIVAECISEEQRLRRETEWVERCWTGGGEMLMRRIDPVELKRWGGE